MHSCMQLCTLKLCDLIYIPANYVGTEEKTLLHNLSSDLDTCAVACMPHTHRIIVYTQNKYIYFLKSQVYLTVAWGTFPGETQHMHIGLPRKTAHTEQSNHSTKVQLADLGRFIGVTGSIIGEGFLQDHGWLKAETALLKAHPNTHGDSWKLQPGALSTACPRLRYQIHPRHLGWSGTPLPLNSLLLILHSWEGAF